MLSSTAAFINCVGGVNGDVPTEMARSDVDQAVTTLLSANAYTIDIVVSKFSLIDLETEVVFN